MLPMLMGCSDKAGGGGKAAPSPRTNLTGNARAAAAPVSDGDGVNPLGSSAVKDAIHRAQRTGQTQRWSDAGLSGYAVPSPAADPRGCRTVRYTIDQQPERTFPVITACDAG